MSELPKFGRYVTVSKLGGGAAGDVYRARDELLGRDVAIKTLRNVGRNAVMSTERFFHEAKAVGALSHPGVIRIFDMGEEAGTPYLVMELASGGSLKDRLENAPKLTHAEVAAVGSQIAAALAAAHARKIVHRDVKPANIIRDSDGAWKLADFGVAHVPDSTLTLAGQFLGSPAYAAPESLEVGQFGAASDVYGLAATLFEALTGAPPWGDRDYAGILEAIGKGSPSIAGRVPDLPAPVADAIDRALARRPDARPSAQELALALDPRLGAVSGAMPAVAVSAASMTAITPVRPVGQKGIPTRTLIYAGVGAILVIGLVAAIASSGGGSSKPTGTVVEPPPHDGDGPKTRQLEESELVSRARELAAASEFEAAAEYLREALHENPRDAAAQKLWKQICPALESGCELDEEESEDDEYDEERDGPYGQWKKKQKGKKGK